MILPVTYVPVLILLIASLFCLGAWINTFKAAGAKWRFELFAIDFSIGGLLVVLIAAFTLGTLGSDLAFSDRMLVAGRTAQALAIIAGAVFNLGNMLLLAAVGLIGISTAFPLTIGFALVISSFFHFNPANLAFLIPGVVVMLACLVFEIRSARLREAAVLASKKDTQPVTAGQAGGSAASAPAAGQAKTAPLRKAKTLLSPKRKAPQRSVRGVVVALIGGLAMGFFVPALQNCVPGDLGLGAYAGMLLFGIGVLVSTIIYNFYFLNITIEGGPLKFGAYFRGNLRQHLLGFGGGAVCLGGLLAAALGSDAPPSVDVPRILDILLPLLSVPLAFLFGATVWKEFAAPSRVKISLVAGLCLFLCGLGLFAVGFTR